MFTCGPAPGIEVRRAETKFIVEYDENYAGLGSRKPGRASARGVYKQFISVVPEVRTEMNFLQCTFETRKETVAE